MNAQSYKYATYALLVLVVILGWMLINKGPATQGVGDAAQSLSECRTALAAWIKTNKNAASASPAARAELDGILKNCQSKVGSPQ